jgi:hypothetical protein
VGEEEEGGRELNARDKTRNGSLCRSVISSIITYLIEVSQDGKSFKGFLSVDRNFIRK